MSGETATAPILIWGTGAIGGTIGAYLARAGHEIVFVDIVPEHVAAIAGPGLQIEGPVEEFRVTAPAFTPDRLSGRFERILLCVKAQHTEGATTALLPFLAADGYVVSAQNGLNELTIAKIVGAKRTIGAFVNFGADYLAPGRILYGGHGAVVLGEIDGAVTPRLTALHRIISDFEPAAIVTDNIWGYLWGKLGYGALLFATALTNDSIADALARPEFRDLYIALARESLAVAAARGVTPEAFDGFDPRAYLPAAPAGAAEASLDALVVHNRKSAKTHSGIWRDLAVRKRPTEVDAQLGIVVQLGREAGVPTPLTARVVELIHDIETGRRAQSLDTLALVADSSRSARDKFPS